jgi:hypothetical protein
MKLNKIASLVRDLLTLAVIPSPTIAITGAIPDPSSLAATLAALTQNGASAAGGWGWQTSSVASGTLTNLAKQVYQYTNGGAVTITLDYAYNICNNLPVPLAVGQGFEFVIVTNAATTIATPTLSDTAVTLAGGATTVTAAGLRWYSGVVTQATTTVGMPVTAGTTFTSLTQVGATNAFTVVLGTNALVPVVGTLINLTGITGTLPAGWYPIVKVTSATSFIIATPKGTTWTATAATVGTSIVAPATYSPTITITGMFGTVLNTMVV